MSTDGNPIATACEVNSGTFASFSDHPASACNSGNFWPIEKCQTSPNTLSAAGTSGLIAATTGHGRHDLMGNTFLRFENLFEFLGASDASDAFGKVMMPPSGDVVSPGVRSFVRDIFAAARTATGGLTIPDYFFHMDLTIGSGYTEGSEFGSWMWNPYINMWVMENTDLSPRRSFYCDVDGDGYSDTGTGATERAMTEEEAEVLAEILETYDPTYRAVHGISDMSSGVRTTTHTIGEKNGQPYVEQMKHRFTTNASLIAKLQPNFMSITREPYETEGGDDFWLYGSISDFIAPTVSTTNTDFSYTYRGDAAAAIGVDAGRTFQGKKFSVSYSEQEAAGLRYLFGFPAEYTGNQRRFNYINDKIDALGEDLLVSNLIYSFTYNRKRTPILERNSFEAFPAQISSENLKINTIAASSITPDDASADTMISALATALTRLRPGDDYSGLADTGRRGEGIVAIGGGGTVEGSSRGEYAAPPAGTTATADGGGPGTGGGTGGMSSAGDSAGGDSY